MFRQSVQPPRYALELPAGNQSAQDLSVNPGLREFARGHALAAAG
jgi:hypothetical protein